MKQTTLCPEPDRGYPGKYVYGEAVPVNIYIGGQKVDAPKAGVKVGRPAFPDTMPPTVALKIGDYIDDKGGAKE